MIHACQVKIRLEQSLPLLQGPGLMIAAIKTAKNGVPLKVRPIPGHACVASAAALAKRSSICTASINQARARSAKF